jgi:inorganic pyrophosphatase
VIEIINKWRQYIKEEKEIASKDELIKHLELNPADSLPTKINIENPKGSMRSFKNTEEQKLPFHYGEWSDLKNPADGDPWDLIIAPNSSETSQNLKPVGHVEYTDGSGNDKIIIADGGNISDEEKEAISNFFSGLENAPFKEPEWY